MYIIFISFICFQKANRDTQANWGHLSCKDFDSVIVTLLLYKLRIMGVNQQIIDWIAEYFNGIQKLVWIGSNATSSPINVISGVGQGSAISSLLFNLFLFDLPFFANSASKSCLLIIRARQNIYLNIKYSNQYFGHFFHINNKYSAEIEFKSLSKYFRQFWYLSQMLRLFWCEIICNC